MSFIWSGRTVYDREVDARGREVFVPRGFAPHPAYQWRVKQDPVSGKYFFVNQAGLSKRWRLPDLTDEAYVLELREKLAATQSPAGPMRDSAFTSRTISTTPGSEFQRPSSVSGGGSLDDMVSSSPVLYIASPNSRLRDAPTTFNAAATPHASAATDPLHMDAAPSERLQSSPATVGGGGAAAAFVYDDAEWRKLENERRRVQQLAQRDAELHLAREAELAEMTRDGGAAGLNSSRGAGTTAAAAAAASTGTSNLNHPAADVALASHGRRHASTTHHTNGASPAPPPPPHPLHTPYDEFVDYTELSKAAAIQSELVKRRMDDEDRRRTIRSELDTLAEEERLLQLQTAAEEVKLRHLQEVQRESLQPQPSIAGGRYPDEKQHRQGGPSSHLSLSQRRPTPDDDREAKRGPTDVRRPVFQQQAVAQLPSVDPYDVASPPTATARETALATQVEHLTSVIQTMQKLLEHERQQNEKLTRQLEERDRLALEQLAAETQREQREIALRIRMLEAIAAHRKEKQLLADQEAAKRDAEEDTIRAQLLRSGERYIPRHPLEGDDASEDEEWR